MTLLVWQAELETGIDVIDQQHQRIVALINQLGEAILGEEEAEKRMQAVLARLASPDCDYLSIKISAIFSQIHLIADTETLEKLKERQLERHRLEPLVGAQPVQRRGEVGRGVGERAVEIEQHRAARQFASPGRDS